MLSTATHCVRRTSPPNEEFRGACLLCGARDLPESAARQPCPNPRGLRLGDAIVEALRSAERPRWITS